MPISVSCVCGKVFKVKDEQAGQQVICQVCGRTLIAPLADPAPTAIAPFEAPIPQAELPRAYSPPAAPATIPCPTCGESISPNASICPYCNELVSGTVSKIDRDAILKDALAKLDAHIADPIAQSEDRKMFGRATSGKTITAGIITGFVMALTLLAGTTSRNASIGGILGMALFMGFIPAICLLVSYLNDSKASHIQNAKTPEEALKNFFTAVRTGRTAKAFVALTPSARTSGPAKTIEFTHKSIPSHKEKFSIFDLPSFKAYWKSIFTGPSMNSRSVKIGAHKRLESSADTAVVQTEFAITSYPSLAILGIFACGPIPTMILILILQKKEKQSIKKFLIKRSGKWYIAESQLTGPLDSASN